MLFQTGDPVWAKMKGFPPWPGKVDKPTADMKKPSKRTIPFHCIYFFGSKNYAWIEESKLKPYAKFREALGKSCKTPAFKEALRQVEEYVKDPQAYVEEKGLSNMNDDEFNKLLKEDFIKDKDTPIKSAKASKPKPKRSAKRSLSTGSASANAVNVSKSRNSVSGVTSPKQSRLSNSADDSAAFDSSIMVANDYGGSNPSESPELNAQNGSRKLPPRKDMSASLLLDQTARLNKPDTPPLDLQSVSHILLAKNIKPSNLVFGFLGLGNMGSGIVKNLLNSGHRVCVWNRTRSKSLEFQKVGAEVSSTPCDVVETADITFSCVSDPQASKEMVFGNCGVLQASTVAEGKGYVEMTGIDSDTSQDIAEAIIAKGGRYLEAQIQGSKSQAEEGSLVLIAAGDKGLFDDCQSCFEAISKHSFFLGQIGNASKLNIVLQMINGITILGLAEGMALADRAGLLNKDVLEVMQLTPTASPALVDKAKSIIKGDFVRQMPLSLMQKDIKLALDMSDALVLPLPLAASANEVYKHAKRLGMGDHDVSAIYMRARY